MPKLPGVRHQDAVRVFEKLGFRIIRQSGHIVMSNGDTRLTMPNAWFAFAAWRNWAMNYDGPRPIYCATAFTKNA